MSIRASRKTTAMSATAFFALAISSCQAFAPAPQSSVTSKSNIHLPHRMEQASSIAVNPSHQSPPRSKQTQLHFFEALDKAFEDEGPLGKGITVGKVQIALSVSGAERGSSDSIFTILEENARANKEDDSGYDEDYDDGLGESHLSQMCHQVCLALMRKSDDWIAACSESKWFKGEEYGKAESLYNQWADREAAKFEKEYIPEEGSAPKDGSPTVAVVSLIVEIQGDETNFERAGFSIAETKSVLSSIASDCRVEGGDCLNAVEVFWTPSEPTEVLTERDTILDFPELISF